MLIQEQLKTGTAVALFWGLCAGSLLGLAIVSTENHHLIFPTAGTSVLMVIFSATATAVLSAIVLIPLELFLALLMRRTATLITPVRLYASALTVGAAWFFCFLWLSFRAFRDSRSAQSIAFYFLLTAGAAVLLIVINILPASTRKVRRWRGAGLCLVICVVLAAASYARLRHIPQLSGNPERTSTQEQSPIESTAGTAARKNVLLISIDTLRADHLTPYGYRLQTSPNLNRFAEQAVVFRNAFSAAPWTLPSHASLFTSLYPSVHGARFSSRHAPVLDPLDRSHVTLAEILQAAGYHTGAFTTIFWFDPPWGLQQGFASFRMDGSQPANHVVDSAIRWVKDSKQPFFLFLHFYDVHNYTATPEFEKIFVDGTYHGKLDTQKLLTSRNAYSSLSTADLKYLQGKYDASIAFVDHEIGRLLAWLQSRGLYGETTIVITSDHGEEFWDHGGTGHGFTLYSEILHVPLLLKPADRIDPREIADAVSLIDVFPTILDTLGIRPPAGIQGRSLRPLLEGNHIPDRALYAEDTYYMNSSTAMQGDYKYIENRVPPTGLLNLSLFFVNLRTFIHFRPNELYNIEHDPLERSNILDQEPAIEQRMRKDLLQRVRLENALEQGTVDEATRERLRSLGYTQ